MLLCNNIWVCQPSHHASVHRHVSPCMPRYIALPRCPSHPLPLPRFTFLLARYVEQFDTLLGILTVYEMLMYTGEAAI